MRCLILLLLALSAGNPVAADYHVPAYVIALPASVDSVFVADAGDARFYHYRQVAGRVDLVHASYMSVGENGVDKQRAWDRRTPLGIYFVTDQLDTRRLHEKYGITAFPLDYPNTWDRRLGRSGDGIWLHGVLAGGGPRPVRDTDGCLALPNEDLRVIERHIEPLVTPVIVTREMRWLGAAERGQLRDELRQHVDAWSDALARGDAHAYLSSYAPDFTHRGLTRREWSSLRAQRLAERGPADVDVDELLLLADPVETELYLARFRQTITTAEGRTQTMKRLYWRRDDTGALRIVAEDNG